ncbi:MAG: LysE family translocator [Rhodobacteraceae bacterium]|nr:LysE family translocator [Paracoccaceae bacterium]
MIAFIAAVIFLLITPGPGVLTTAGIGAAYGFRSGLGFIAGLCIGGFLVMIAVITGVAAIVFTVPWLRWILLIASAAYLLFLAYRVATAGSRVGFINPGKPLGFWNGLMLQPINPKAYVVASTLFSGFPILPDSLLWETVIKLVVFNLIWIPIHLIWLWAGVQLHELNVQQHVQRRINIGMALAMVVVVVLALLALD